MNYFGPVIWTDDAPSYQAYVISNSLVLSWDGAMAHIPQREDCFYIHHANETALSKVPKSHKLILMTYQNMPQNTDIIKFAEACYYNKVTQTLYQPWGTFLEADEFCSPTFNKDSVVMNWVGSVWVCIEDPLASNVEEVELLKQALVRYNISFKQSTNTTIGAHRELIRASRIVPQTASKWVVNNNYLTCRVFKNISFGQMSGSIVDHFKHIYGDSMIIEPDIFLLVDKMMAVPEKEYLERIIAQQEYTKNYTYSRSIERILNAIDIIKQG
jgi:hypothetical protein